MELRQAAGDGTSEPVEILTAGEAFGQAGPPAAGGWWEAVARTDVLAYLIPGEQLDRLRTEAGFDGLLAGRAGDRLRHAVAEAARRMRDQQVWSSGASTTCR